MNSLSLHPWWLFSALLFTVALVQTVRIWWHRCHTRRKWQQRRVRARSGEEGAERLLADCGFRVLRRQHQQPWTITVDGSAEEVKLRADLLVEKDAKQYVVEVKTGAIAPNIRTPATRRQLLEYRLAYDVDGVLLADMERYRIHRIDFPLRTRSWHNARVLWWLAFGVVSGVLLSEAVRTLFVFVEQ